VTVLDAVGVVTELNRRFRGGDAAGAFALFDPAIRIEQPASLPHGGAHLGHDGVARMGAAFAEHWTRTIDAPRIHGSGSHGTGSPVTQLTTQTWTAKSTGRAATVDVVELITVTDGLVTEIRVFQQDTHALLATLPGGQG
jgi:hypothetical protein